MIIFVLVAAVIVITFHALANGDSGLSESRDAVSALVDEGRTLARNTSDGATVVITPAGGGWQATLYSGRPGSGGLGTAESTASGSGTLTVATFQSAALLLDSSGALTAAAWNGSGVSGTPGCSASVPATLTLGASTLSWTYSC